tara:strand:+ start:384 stop:656 length:273 start_codon:yes stop_codon:yes gene_type:complete
MNGYLFRPTTMGRGHENARPSNWPKTLATIEQDGMAANLAAHRHPLTIADCAALRRIAVPMVILGGILLLLMVIRALATFETALAAASGV